MVLFSFLNITSALTPEQGVVQILVEKQQLHSVALGRLSEEYDIPLYFQLPTVREHGTGIALGEGLILTNYHVIQGAIGLGVQTSSSQIVSAQIVSSIPDLDLAWLQLEEEILLDTWEYSPLDLQIDQAVWTGGFAFDLRWSEKQAFVKDLNRIDILSDERQHFTVLDQEVPAGYSGGPVWNSDQKLVGMMTATNAEKQEAYFITVQEIAMAWHKIQVEKKISWGDIGISVSDNKIVSVNPYSPASRLPLGTIERVQGRDLSENVSKMPLDAQLRRFQIGQLVSLQIDRKEYSIPVQDFSAWGDAEDTCLWNGAYLKRETNFWKIVSLREEAPLRSMGARPNDLLQIDETCSDVHHLGSKILPIQRGEYGFHIILSKDSTPQK